MNTEFTRYEVADGVATVTLHRPDALNAFNAGLRRELLAHIHRAEADRLVRAVVLSGAGRAFSAGADLLEPYDPPHASIESQILLEYRPALDAITSSAKPWIAAVRGVAAGIGMSFALACDLLLMAEGAELFPAFAGVGLVPDGGATWFLVQAVGYRRAYEIIVLARRLPDSECVSMGLANEVLAAEGFDAAVAERASQIARCSPLVLHHAKRLARAVTSGTLEQCLRDEAAAQHLAITSPQAQAAFAAFRQRRPDAASAAPTHPSGGLS